MSVAWGLLSTARINESIIGAARESDRAHVLAVASRDAGRAEAYALEHGIERSYGSYEALLGDSDVEAVYISLPNAMHVGWTVRALEAGKHVLCEKPFSRHPDEVEQAFDLADATGLVLSEGFMWRHHPQTAKLVELVADGVIGPLRVVRAAFSFQLAAVHGAGDARFDPDLDGGSLMDVGSYCLSAIRLLGGEPKRLQGQQVVGPSWVDVCFAASLALPDDRLGHFDCGFVLPSRGELEVVGESLRGRSLPRPRPGNRAPPPGRNRADRGRARQLVPARARERLRRDPRRGAAPIGTGGRARPGTRDRSLVPLRLHHRWECLMTHMPADDRYERMQYRRSGDSGLQLPAVSLGLWNNFGHDHPYDTSRAIVRRAFDLGITHFDLANNYGPPYGSAEENFGRMIENDLRPFRDELAISTKAGYDMWPGPYGEWGSRKYLLSSLDQSLSRMKLDYVDLFYSHRFDPDTPLAETMGALDTAVRQGKALYVGISSYSAEKTREAAAILRELGTPCVIHQPSYSMLNRWIEPDLIDALGELGIGCIVFSPLAQGMLTDKYLDGIPEGSRASRESSLSPDLLTPQALEKIRALNEIAERRGQSLAQMAVAWVLRDERVTSALVGASSVAQLEANVAALENLDFSTDELAEIDKYATDSGINLWAGSSSE